MRTLDDVDFPNKEMKSDWTKLNQRVIRIEQQNAKGRISFREFIDRTCHSAKSTDHSICVAQFRSVMYLLSDIINYLIHLFTVTVTCPIAPAESKKNGSFHSVSLPLLQQQQCHSFELACTPIDQNSIEKWLAPCRQKAHSFGPACTPIGQHSLNRGMIRSPKHFDSNQAVFKRPYTARKLQFILLPHPHLISACESRSQVQH